MVIVALAIVGYFIEFTLTSTPASTTTSQTGTTIDCSRQADRIAFIDSMIDKGYWQRIEAPTSVYRVYVLPAFMRKVTFEDKQQNISVVSAYSICKKGESTVGIYDSMTGKRIGRYDNGGLHLD
jgi:hypothetical protein